MTTYMNKAEFVKMFTSTDIYREQIKLPSNRRDRVMLREMWNNWLDSLICDGKCRERAGNWLHIPTIA